MNQYDPQQQSQSGGGGGFGQSTQPMDYQRQQELQRQRQRQDQTVVNIEVTGESSPDAFAQLAQQWKSEPGIKAVKISREGGRPRLHVWTTQESLPNIQSILGQVATTVQQAYAGSFR